MNLTKWLDKNSKVLGSLIILLLPALGITTFTAVEQHQELTELRTVIVEVPVEINEPVHSHDHSHKQITELSDSIGKLKNRVTKLEGWH